MKNFVVRPNVPLRRMDGNWRNRAMQFTDLGSGDLNMVRYVEMLINIGYPNRYNKIMGTKPPRSSPRQKATTATQTPPPLRASNTSATSSASQFPKAPSRTKWARKKPANEFSGHGNRGRFLLDNDL